MLQQLLHAATICFLLHQLVPAAKTASCCNNSFMLKQLLHAETTASCCNNCFILKQLFVLHQFLHAAKSTTLHQLPHATKTVTGIHCPTTRFTSTFKLLLHYETNATCCKHCFMLQILLKALITACFKGHYMLQQRLHPTSIPKYWISLLLHQPGDWKARSILGSILGLRPYKSAKWVQNENKKTIIPLKSKHTPNALIWKIWTFFVRFRVFSPPPSPSPTPPPTLLSHNLLTRNEIWKSFNIWEDLRSWIWKITLIQIIHGH